MTARSSACGGEPGPGPHDPADAELAVELDQVGPLADRDPARADRVMQVMLTMTKLEIAPLQEAYAAG